MILVWGSQLWILVYVIIYSQFRGGADWAEKGG